jgi:hypothetical protein
MVALRYAVLGDAVILGPPIVVAGGPLGFDQALLLKLVKRRIQGTLTDQKHVVRHLTDALGDRPPVHRLERDNLENQEIERALHEIGRFAHVYPSVTDKSISVLLSVIKGSPSSS